MPVRVRRTSVSTFSCGALKLRITAFIYSDLRSPVIISGSLNPEKRWESGRR